MANFETVEVTTDILLCGGGKPGECADLFNRTAHAIAVLAFVPGGVTIFGATFEANPPPERKQENDNPV